MTLLDPRVPSRLLQAVARSIGAWGLLDDQHGGPALSCDLLGILWQLGRRARDCGAGRVRTQLLSREAAAFSSQFPVAVTSDELGFFDKEENKSGDAFATTT
ncbi:unnamed protein product [Symbiodinium natans]|uniref:Uncharacterized protein n=1 Tax=Symbiodinium natans TaxID=878477 RepID=A0A812T2F1_9DINO|nr:unnamed protein product [Symbiodinium natans]